MLSFFKKLFQSAAPAEEQIALQPLGVAFPWPRGTQLTAIEPMIIAIPAATLAADDKIESVVLGDPDMGISLPMKPGDSLIYLLLKAGQSVSLSKSVQGFVVANDKDDKAAKRIRVRTPQS